MTGLGVVSGRGYAHDNREYVWDEAESERPEHPHIEQWITPRSRVVDLASGNGTLLRRLKRDRHIIELGIEISPSGVAACLASGLNAQVGRVDVELKEISDDAFDFAICNVTLQMVMYPEITLREMCRIARYQIISFPNFAWLLNRLELLILGRMPRRMLGGYSWYNTGHIHQLSLRDFITMTAHIGMVVRDRVLLSKFGRLAAVRPNLLTSTAIFLLEKKCELK